MKRRPELHPLTWEHHDALVICRRLELGLKKGADPTVMRTFVLHFHDYLTAHFQAEEKYLVKRLQPETTSLPAVQQVLTEHRRFDRLFAQLDAPTKELRPLLAEFAGLLRHHVEMEEKEFYPLVENELTAEQLAAAGKDLQNYYRELDKSWTPEFWK
jgi:hemerythrin-like domain-containing protein